MVDWRLIVHIKTSTWVVLSAGMIAVLTACEEKNASVLERRAGEVEAVREDLSEWGGKLASVRVEPPKKPVTLDPEPSADFEATTVPGNLAVISFESLRGDEPKLDLMLEGQLGFVLDWTSSEGIAEAKKTGRRNGKKIDKAIDEALATIYLVVYRTRKLETKQAALEVFVIDRRSSKVVLSFPVIVEARKPCEDTGDRVEDMRSAVFSLARDELARQLRRLTGGDVSSSSCLADGVEPTAEDAYDDFKERLYGD